MTVAAVVYNPANTGSAIASTDVTDSEGAVRGLLDADADTELGKHTGITIEVHRSHPSASAFTPKRVVRLIDGSGDEVKFRIRTVEDRKIRGNAAGEILQVSGDTLLHDWTRARVEGHLPPDQEPQSDVVAYNFATPGRDMSDFTDTAYVQPRAGAGSTAPAFWPDPFSQPVWTNTEDPGTALGSIFGVRDFTLATPAQVVIKMSADDGFIPWLHGCQFPERKPRTYGTDRIQDSTWNGVVADLEAGTYRFGVEAKNIAGIAALWVSAWRTDAILLGDPLFITGTDESNPIIGDWKWSAYPSSRPGVPILMPVVDFLDRAQTRGAMLDWSLGFTADEDSNSDAVPVEEFSIETRRHGLDLLDAIALDHCTFKVRKGAGLILDATLAPGVASGETYADDEVDELTRTVAA